MYYIGECANHQPEDNIQKTFVSVVPSAEIKQEGPEGVHFLSKSYPGSCCVSTKGNEIN